MIRRRRPSCCLLVVIRCAMLCTTAAMGFAPEITNKSCLLAVSSLSSLSFRKQFNKPQYLSSAHHHHHHAGSFFVHDQKFSALSMLRGGGSVVVAVPVSSIMKAVPLAVQTTTAYASVLFLVVSNLALLVAPNFMLETVCNNTKPTSSSSSSSSVATSDNAAAAAAAANNVASATFVRLIATAGLGVALSLYLAIIRESSSPLIAMGWGLVPRLILFWYLLLFENRMNSNSNSLLPSFGSLQENKRFFMVNTILTTWVTASLLLGLGKNPAMTARIFSTMSIIKCSLLILRPLSVGSKFVGFDVGRKGLSKTRAVLRVLGNEFLVSAVFMASLAFGWNVVKAAGLVFALRTVLLLLNVAIVSKPWRRTTLLIPEEAAGPRPRMLKIINIVISMMFAAGFLVPFIVS